MGKISWRILFLVLAIISFASSCPAANGDDLQPDEDAGYGIIGLKAVDEVKKAAVESEKAVVEHLEDKNADNPGAVSVIQQSSGGGIGSDAGALNAASLMDAYGALTVNVFDAVSGEYINDASVSITSKGLPKQVLNTNGATTFTKLRPALYQVAVALNSAHPQLSYFAPAKKLDINLPAGAQLTANIYMMPRKMPDLDFDVRVRDASYTSASLYVASGYKILRYHMVVKDRSKPEIFLERDLGPTASPFEFRLDNLEDGKDYAVDIKADFLSQVTAGSLLGSKTKTVNISTARLPDFVIGKFEVSPAICSKERNDIVLATARIKLYHRLSALKIKISSGRDLLYARTFSNLSKGMLNIRVPIPSSSFSAAGERDVRLVADFDPGKARQTTSSPVIIVDNAFLRIDIKPEPEKPRTLQDIKNITIVPVTREMYVFEKSVSRISAILSTSVSGVSATGILPSEHISGGAVIDAEVLGKFADSVAASLAAGKFIPDIKITVKGKVFYDEDEVVLGEKTMQFLVFEDVEKTVKVAIAAQGPLTDREPFEFSVAASSSARFDKLKIKLDDEPDDAAVEVNPVLNSQTGNFEVDQKFRRTYTFSAENKARLVKDRTFIIKASIFYTDLDRWSGEHVSDKVQFISSEESISARQARPQVELVILQDVYSLERSVFRARLSCPLVFSKVRFDCGDGAEPEVVDVPSQGTASVPVEFSHIYKEGGDFPLRVSVFLTDYNLWSGTNDFYKIKVLPVPAIVPDRPGPPRDASTR